MEEYIALYKEKGYVGLGIMPKYVLMFGVVMLFVLVLGSAAGALVEKKFLSIN